MSVGGTPEKCPKPCPSVSFDLNPIEITDASQFGENEINTCSDQIQPVELEDFPEVESNDSESDIDPFSTMYGDMDEDSFHRMMEGNDWTYTPLFSDKEFLNEDWHNTHVLRHVLPLGMQGMDASLLGQVFRVSEKLMTQAVHYYLK